MPSLKLGTSSIKGLRLGTAVIKQAYLGGTKVFNAAFQHTYTGDNKTGRNLNNDLLAAGWDGVEDVEVTINSGVDIGAPNTSTYAIDCHSMPNAVVLTIINKGYIRGAGGAGGKGKDDDGSGSADCNGLAGGHALRLGCITIIDNGAGYIYGGGGGGGGGGMNSVYTYFGPDGKAPAYWEWAASGGGGGGGGGAGYNQGAGGTEQISGSHNGAPGSLNSGGAGKDPGGNHTKGGNGGGPGSAGAQGETGDSSASNISSGEAAGGFGGAAGKSIQRNGFVATFLSGNTSTRVKGANS